MMMLFQSLRQQDQISVEEKVVLKLCGVLKGSLSALSLFLDAPKSYVMAERVPANDGVCL